MLVYEARTVDDGIKYTTTDFPSPGFQTDIDNRFGDKDYRKIKENTDFEDAGNKAPNLEEFIRVIENRKLNAAHFFLDGTLFYRLEKGLYIERKTTRPVDHLKTEFGHADEEAVSEYEDRVIDMRDELTEN